MCFSADASLGAAVVLLPVGGYCAAAAATRTGPTCRWPPSPSCSALQQLCEAGCGLGLDRGDPDLARAASRWFLFFALARLAGLGPPGGRRRRAARGSGGGRSRPGRGRPRRWGACTTCRSSPGGGPGPTRGSSGTRSGTTSRPSRRSAGPRVGLAGRLPGGGVRPAPGRPATAACGRSGPWSPWPRPSPTCLPGGLRVRLVLPGRRPVRVPRLRPVPACPDPRPGNPRTPTPARPSNRSGPAPPLLSVSLAVLLHCQDRTRVSRLPPPVPVQPPATSRSRSPLAARVGTLAAVVLPARRVRRGRRLPLGVGVRVDRPRACWSACTC